ncbi:MAG: type II secretion system F family protein [Ilumatobacteraceae bacterium]
MIALLVGALVVLIAAPAAARLRPSVRLPGPDVDHSLRRVQSTSDYAALLDAIARQVRSGSTLASAVADEAGCFAGLGGVVEHLASGSSLIHALAMVEPTDADVALTLQVLSATAHLGGPIAATLDEAATVLRERAAARAERWAQGAQARLSARVLTIVPLGFAGWSAIAGERTRAVYLTSGAGAACALAGLVLNVVGWHWMKKIIGPA